MRITLDTTGRSDASPALHGGVTDNRSEIPEKMLGMLLAAAAAAICAAIDYVLKEE